MGLHLAHNGIAFESAESLVGLKLKKQTNHKQKRQK